MTSLERWLDVLELWASSATNSELLLAAAALAKEMKARGILVQTTTPLAPENPLTPDDHPR